MPARAGTFAGGSGVRNEFDLRRRYGLASGHRRERRRCTLEAYATNCRRDVRFSPEFAYEIVEKRGIERAEGSWE